MKDAGGIHNTTLKIGPPAQFMQAGRYICLVNNPEGHAHKEIFVRVLTDQQIQSSIQSKYHLRNYQLHSSLDLTNLDLMNLDLPNLNLTNLDLMNLN